MAWQMSGTYLATCDCQLICPCPVDSPPTAPGGQCHGVAVFQVRDGSLDDTDLSGTTFAFANIFPSNLTAGNWTFGVVIDESASDEQAQALERVLHGEEGGPFADFAPLFGEWLGAQRGRVSFSDGDSPSASVDDTNVSFEPLPGPAGQTTVKNAMFGFAPEYRVGHGKGQANVLGIEFDSSYGETADFEFSSEMGEEAPRGRG